MSAERMPAAEPRDEMAVRRLRMWIRMLGITRAAENRVREFLRAEHGTTLPRFDVIAALYSNRDGMTMTELSRKLLVSNGNTTSVVDRLEKDGMAVRVPSQTDRRTINVVLTPEGAAMFENIAAEHRALVDAMFPSLDDRDLDTLRDIFRRMRKDLI